MSAWEPVRSEPGCLLGLVTWPLCLAHPQIPDSQGMVDVSTAIVSAQFRPREDSHHTCWEPSRSLHSQVLGPRASLGPWESHAFLAPWASPRRSDCRGGSCMDLTPHRPLHAKMVPGPSCVGPSITVPQTGQLVLPSPHPRLVGALCRRKTTVRLAPPPNQNPSPAAPSRSPATRAS